ncbi:MAG TPA: vWA domain-containing protein, partial [Treponemataceae bacterium]|nr:vWA domain-containing protein [Treponemataceae bacterium]
MNCKFLVVLTLCFTLAAGFLHAGERTIPVDMILMIDKSLSMDETGKFDSLRQWVRDQLVSQMLIEGDWVAVFQFYEQPDQLLETTIAGPDTIEKISQTINGIKPDGPFTDIGAALDAIRDAIEPRTQNGRHKVMLLLTDLRQEAPWSSRYAGVQDTYSSPY